MKRRVACGLKNKCLQLHWVFSFPPHNPARQRSTFWCCWGYVASGKDLLEHYRLQLRDIFGEEQLERSRVVCTHQLLFLSTTWGFVRAGEAASSFQSDLQQCGYWEGSLHPAFLSVCVISVFVPQSHSRLRMYCWSLNVHGHVCHFGCSGAAAELPSVWMAPRISTLNVRRK